MPVPAGLDVWLEVDTIMAATNQGRDMEKANIRTIDQLAPVAAVHASRGKGNAG